MSELPIIIISANRKSGKDFAYKFIRDFESMRYNAELRALQTVSLERELSDKEFQRFKELANKKFSGEL